MIKKLDTGEYVASSHNVWIPGVFEDERTAKYAFKFKNRDLQKLQNKKNLTDKVIRFKDLQKLRIEIQSRPFEK